jgi:hypothetical protein
MVQATSESEGIRTYFLIVCTKMPAPGTTSAEEIGTGPGKG